MSSSRRRLVGLLISSIVLNLMLLYFVVNDERGIDVHVLYTKIHDGLEKELQHIHWPKLADEQLHFLYNQEHPRGGRVVKTRQKGSKVVTLLVPTHNRPVFFFEPCPFSSRVPHTWIVDAGRMQLSHHLTEPSGPTAHARQALFPPRSD